jgi:hypothetical protein
MKYTAPEVTALMPAIRAIQTAAKIRNHPFESPVDSREVSAAYEDWES